MTNKQVYGEDIDIAFLTLDNNTKKYLSNFSCGNSEIDRYFHDEALNDRNTVTHIFIDKQKDIAIALVSIGCSKIDYINKEYENGVKHIYYVSSTPAIEIKYFATDTNYHKIQYYKDSNSTTTLSKMIMANTIKYIQKLSKNHIGASKIILNSVPEAINFYKACFFKVYDINMDVSEFSCYKNSRPMYFNLSSD